MKNIMKIIAGLTCIMLLSGCSVYQHVRVASDAPQNDQSEFLIENDSLSIIYSFKGQSGPIYMELFNKLDKPFYVDWSKSSLIVEGLSYSFWKDEAKMSGTSTHYEVITQDGVARSVGNLNGSIVKNDKVTFIPPHSRIDVNSFALQDQFFIAPPEAGVKTRLHTIDGSKRAMKYSFSKEDSPLNFRIFLTLAMDDRFEKPLQIDNTFWVSDYITTPAAPKALGLYPENQFYNWKRTSFNRTMGVVSTVGIIVVGAAFSDNAGN